MAATSTTDLILETGSGKGGYAGGALDSQHLVCSSSDQTAESTQVRKNVRKKKKKTKPEAPLTSTILVNYQCSACGQLIDQCQCLRKAMDRSLR